ncbi:hypothetical protein LCGC14_0224620 [marine sediment metagenome]|uniref:Uncharacterized protein n=1 Tax=marine sediment metagenome TaxID=412755 RepID=A0A0F9XG60_9ZZZZ|nr:hypothetical protein [bacterium]
MAEKKTTIHKISTLDDAIFIYEPNKPNSDLEDIVIQFGHEPEFIEESKATYVDIYLRDIPYFCSKLLEVYHKSMKIIRNKKEVK